MDNDEHSDETAARRRAASEQQTAERLAKEADETIVIQDGPNGQPFAILKSRFAIYFPDRYVGICDPSVRAQPRFTLTPWERAAALLADPLVATHGKFLD